jgi:hypothetical protein
MPGSHLEEKDINLTGKCCPVHPLKVKLKKRKTITDNCDETCAMNGWQQDT